MQSKMHRNIGILYVFKVARSFMLMIPIIVPFFQQNGLSQTHIFVLQTVFALTIVALEVPSGYFADTIGRKTSLIWGSLIGTLGFFLYSVSFSFLPILIAEIALGIGYSLFSGADDALAYDSLKALNKEKQYLTYESNVMSLVGTSEAAASVIGGLLALLSLRTPMIVEVFTFGFTIPLTLLLTEPIRTKATAKNPFKEVLRITKYALHGHTEIKWLILYGASVGTLTHTMVWLTQPYYQLVNIPLGLFGILWALQLVCMSIFARYTIWYEKLLGKKLALISFPIIGCASYIILGAYASIFTLPLILGFYFVRGVQMPILKHYVNSIVDSDIRATVLSVKNLVQKLLYAALGPMIGVATDTYSLQTGLLFSAGLYGILSLIVLLNMKKHDLL